MSYSVLCFTALRQQNQKLKKEIEMMRQEVQQATITNNELTKANADLLEGEISVKVRSSTFQDLLRSRQGVMKCYWRLTC